MRTLRFSARGQSLAKLYGCKGIVAGSRGYLRARFRLSADYDGCFVAAAFATPDGREYAVPLTGDTCDVPDEVAAGQQWAVRLVAVRRDGFRLETNAVEIQQEVV